MILNMLYMLAILAGFEASLTLPGIAGLVLTIGMAVDANIIIYERIREELRLGKSVRTAVDAGFARAFWTVFDAHVTNFVAGVVLYSYGSGPIRGFAVTLLVGIITNLFTSYWVSHWMFDALVGRRGAAKPPCRSEDAMAAQNPEQKFFEVIKPDSNYEFIGRQKYWIGLSIVLTRDDGRDAPAQRLRLQVPRALPELGRRLPRRQRDPHRVLASPVEAGDMRKTLAETGFPDADVVKYADPTGEKKWNYMVRVGAVSVVSEAAGQADPRIAGARSARRRSSASSGRRAATRSTCATTGRSSRRCWRTRSRRSASTPTQVQPFGRAEDNTYEVTLVGLDTEIRRALDAQAGRRARWPPSPRSSRWAPKAGKQLQVDGAKSLLYAILLIMVYIAFRFDMRYGPGTVVALLHDAVITDRRVRGHLQGILADDGRGGPDHHRLLDERHHRRVRPYPRERGAPARPALRPRRQPVDQRDAVAHHLDQRDRVLRDAGDERASASASSATSRSR